MDYELGGKTALVTGASQGLGRQFALTLARAGAGVVVASRNTDRLDELAREIETGGGSAHAVSLDVTDGASIDAAVETAIEQAGAIDILVNNAGLAVNALIRDTTPDDYDLVMDTNVRGAYFMAKRVGAHMQERGQGKIINLSSILGDYVMPGVSVYCMSKAAISQMTKAMALEFARGNVHVYALAPGFVHTEINAAFFETPRGQEIMGRFPGQTLLQPKDLDASLLFLASAASDQLTGLTLHINDGQALGAFQAAGKQEKR
jgi:hypothetical protein